MTNCIFVWNLTQCIDTIHFWTIVKMQDHNKDRLQMHLRKVKLDQEIIQYCRYYHCYYPDDWMIAAFYLCIVPKDASSDHHFLCSVL